MPPLPDTKKKKRNPSARDILVGTGASLGTIGESGRLTGPSLPTGVNQESGALTPFTSAPPAAKDRILRPGEESVAVSALTPTPVTPQVTPTVTQPTVTQPLPQPAPTTTVGQARPIAPGLPGGVDPAQAGVGNQLPFDQRAAAPPTPTVTPTAPDVTGAVGAGEVTTTDGQVINPVTGGVSEAQTEADRLAAQFAGGIAPSAAELGTQQQIDVAGANLGLDLLANRQRTVAQPFITGAAAALERQSALKTSVLEQRLVRQQASRIAGQNVTKFALERADKKVEAERGTEGFTLGQGQQRFDAQGNVIAEVAPKETVPPASTDPNRVLSVAEAKTLGVAFGTTAAQALGITPEAPLTERQSKSLAFGTRMTEASPIVDELTEFASTHNSVTFAAALAAEANTVTSPLVSDKFRQMRQAERNFLNAVLRQESGAVINPDEFENGAKQYFPRPGDDQTTLDQKKTNRDTATRTMLQGINAPDTTQPQDTGDLVLEGVTYTDDGTGTGNLVPKDSGGTEGADVAVNIPQESRLSSVNNNPGNLRFAQQTGASQGEGGFARFDSPQAGFQALKNQISLDASRGLTLRQFISKFAPPTENDTELYISQMVEATGAGENTQVSQIDLDALAQAMAKKESSTTIG